MPSTATQLPLPTPAGDRARKIAAIHAAAEYFAAMPDFPMPRHVNLSCPVDTLEQLEALAETADATIYGDEMRQFDFVLSPGVWIVVYVPRPDRPL